MEELNIRASRACLKRKKYQASGKVGDEFEKNNVAGQKNQKN
jgi:hypothetical protein